MHWSQLHFYGWRGVICDTQQAYVNNFWANRSQCGVLKRVITMLYLPDSLAAEGSRQGVNPDTSREPTSLSQEHPTSAHIRSDLMYVWAVEHAVKCKRRALLDSQRQMVPPPSDTAFPSPPSQKYMGLIYALLPKATFSFAPFFSSSFNCSSFCPSLTFSPLRTKSLFLLSAVAVELLYIAIGSAASDNYIKPILPDPQETGPTTERTVYIYIYIHIASWKTLRDFSVYLMGFRQYEHP